MSGESGTVAGQILLDTCAVLWVAHGEPLSAMAQDRLKRAEQGRESVLVSPISAWEIGLLMARGKIVSSRSPQAWFAALLGHPLVDLAPMPPEVLIDSSCLPGDPPADPADRIIIATARHYGLCVMTRDSRILDYAREGFVQALKC